jgi:hypothetical protein
MVKSKFGFFIYLNAFLITLLIYFSIYLLFHPEIFKKWNGKTSSLLMLLMSMFLLALLLIAFYTIAKLSYIIKIENKVISFRGFFLNTTINNTDIKSINLFSKEDFFWAMGSITIGTRIELQTGKKIIIADHFYKNIDQIKKGLQENFSEKIYLQKKSELYHTIGTILESDFEKFSGNPYTSLNGIIIWGFFISIFCTLLFLNRPLVPAHFIALLPIIVFYIGFGLQLHYFFISNQRLIVKNHFIPWINKSYNIEDIAETNFETPRKRSKSLRITTKDFKSKLFAAGSLREKNWNELKDKLKSLGIYFVEVEN